MRRRSSNAADPEYWLDIEECKARDSVIPAKRSGLTFEKYVSIAPLQPPHYAMPKRLKKQHNFP
ncbi:hypothetical protein H6F88_00055 [Oculatella sp. FACHB-28]|uniref:hypothetical protein n=1 Tax=Oculatella sp. FACHB-28 TaxID=2692845 RepID=UPI00168A34E6|nr:hypothetical protein [Oculatella sp. FACHB-28]MBD2054446.1 hypothetical protein [Oculatella sp. FACHB-28]